MKTVISFLRGVPHCAINYYRNRGISCMNIARILPLDSILLVSVATCSLVTKIPNSGSAMAMNHSGCRYRTLDRTRAKNIFGFVSSKKTSKTLQASVLLRPQLGGWRKEELCQHCTEPNTIVASCTSQLVLL